MALLLGCASAATRSQASVSSISPTYTDPATNLHAELSAGEVQDGSVVLVSVKVPATVKADVLMGNFDGIELPFYPAPEKGEGTYESILGVPHGYKAGPAVVTVKIGEGAEARELKLGLNVVDGKYEVEQLHATDGNYVNPKPKLMKRIKREQKEVGEIYNRVTKKKYWKGAFAMPIPSEFTSPYGTKRMWNGEERSFHSGVDLRAPLGTPIMAPAPGIVVMAKNLYFTGNTVMIDHGYGIITFYAHMSKMKVKKGQFIGKGKLLGLSGATGRVTGPHLHWCAVVHKIKVNPVDFMKVVR